MIGLALALLSVGAVESQVSVVQVLQVLQAFQENQKALLAYRWTSRTEIRLGEPPEQLEHVELFRVQPGAAGRLQRALVPPPEPEDDGEPVQEPEPEEIEPAEEIHAADHFDLAELVRAYQNLDSVSLAHLETRAMLWDDPLTHPGWTQLEATDVVVEGDSYVLWVESSTLRPRRLEIGVPANGPRAEVHATVEYSDLIVGATYPARTRIVTELDGRPLLLTLTGFDYRRRAR